MQRLLHSLTPDPKQLAPVRSCERIRRRVQKTPYDPNVNLYNKNVDIQRQCRMDKWTTNRVYLLVVVYEDRAPARLPARLPACPPARLPACPPARLPACPPARLPACARDCLLFFTRMCMHVCFIQYVS